MPLWMPSNCVGCRATAQSVHGLACLCRALKMKSVNEMSLHAMLALREPGAWARAQLTMSINKSSEPAAISSPSKLKLSVRIGQSSLEKVRRHKYSCASQRLTSASAEPVAKYLRMNKREKVKNTIRQWPQAYLPLGSNSMQ